MKKIILVVIVIAAAIGGGYYFINSPSKTPNNQNNQQNTDTGTDPFANLHPQSFSTQGKVTSISGNTLIFDAAESRIKDGKTYITYESKKATINPTKTIISKYDANRNKKMALLSDIKVGSEVTVTLKENPNQTSEFEALEVLIVK